MATLTMDLVADILLRLPTKSLRRFDCISKSVNDLFNDPYFISLHFRNSVATANEPRRIIFTQRSGLYGKVTFVNPSADQDRAKVERNYPNGSSDLGVNLIGCCNGLLCCETEEGEPFVWNPITNECLKLCQSRSRLDPNPYGALRMMYGFGYDWASDDYKMVKFGQLLHKDSFQFGFYTFKTVEVQVCGLRDRKWREVSGFPYYLRRPACGVLVSGGLHWIGREGLDSSSIIVAFDLSSEKFKKVAMPDFEGNIGGKKQVLAVGVLEDQLCLSCIYKNTCAYVWVMTEYGNQNSWSKLLKLGQLQIELSLSYLVPLVMSKSGEEVLLAVGGSALLWYHLKTKQVKDAVVEGVPEEFEATTFVPTLLKVCSGVETLEVPNLEEMTMKKTKKNRKRKRFQSQHQRG